MNGDPVSPYVYIPPTRAEKEARQSSKFNWSITRIVLVLVTILFLTGIAVGAVFGWLHYANHDDLAPQFTRHYLRDAAIQQQINNEAAARLDADMVLMDLQANLSTVINQEIATRTVQYNMLINLIRTEIAQRKAGEQALYDGIEAERQARITQDIVFDGQLTNLEERIINITNYNTEAAMLFMVKMQNITDLYNRLIQETADRIASEMILMAQIADQNAQIASFSAQLAAETATRQAVDMSLMNQVNALIGDHILFFNDIATVTNSFLFSSKNPLYTFGTGGPYTLTLGASNLVTLNGVFPDAVNSNIVFVAGTNTVISYNGSTVHFQMENTPIEPNRNVYFGYLINPTFIFGQLPQNAVPLFQFINTGWMLDFYPLAVITNFNTPDSQYWEIPSENGASYGTWLVKTRIAIGMYPNSPLFSAGAKFANFNVYSWGNIQGAHCLATTLEQCAVAKITTKCDAANCTNIPIVPQANKGWNNYDAVQFSANVYNGLTGSPVFPGSGFDYFEPFFVMLDITDVIYGWSHPVGTRVYPVWNVVDADRNAALGETLVTSVNVGYDISRIQ